MLTIHQGDCRSILRTMPAGSVNCCVTSPPYFGLRDYGRDGQIGLERTPGDYVTELVDVFREVRRVLTDDGTLWLNLGDSYASSGGPGWQGKHGQRADRRFTMSRDNNPRLAKRSAVDGLKPKDLIGIPWLVAFALRADGWYLRQDIIWHKPNPMPESVRDRCTKAHEYIFMLSKSPSYHLDYEALREPAQSNKGNANGFRGGAYCNNSTFDNSEGGRRTRSGNKVRKPASARGVPVDTNEKSAGAVAGSVPWEDTDGKRNRRSVWTIATRPFKEAHFATFPPDLIEPCILAGCPQGGTVLDPFFGAGTTGLVANKHSRRCIGIELNDSYVEIAKRRLGLSDLPADIALQGVFA